MRGAVIAVVLFLALSAASASALISHQPPASARWERYQITASEPFRGIVFDVEWDGPSAAFKTMYQGPTFVSGGWACFMDRDTHAAVDFDDRGVILYREDNVPASAGFGTSAWEPGTFDLVVLWAGDIRTLGIRADPGVEYALIGSGPAEYRTGLDLEEGAMIKAGVHGAGTYAAATRTLDFEIKHQLFGWFFTSSLFGKSAAVASLRSASTYDECYDTMLMAIAQQGWTNCAFSDREGPRARGPGQYHFEITGVGVEYAEIPLVAWADIPWQDPAVN